MTIDKNEATNVLFDYNDPFSLVSLLYNNQARAIDMNATGMDIKTKRKLEKKGWNSTIEKFWDDADSYLIYDEYGEEVGYSKVDTSYYDLFDINRISITMDTVLNKLTGESYIGIDRLSFYKQFEIDGDYYKVFECSYTLLVELNGFKAWFRTDDKDYLDIHKKRLMEIYNAYVKDGDENVSPSDLGITFFPSYYVGNKPLGNRKLYGGNYDSGQMYPRELNTPTLVSDQSVESWMNSLLFTSVTIGQELNKDSFKALFDSCYMYKESFYDFDEYGDDILIDYYNYYWVDVADFQVYIQADFYSKDPLMHGSNSLNVEKYIYAAKVEKYQ